MTAALLSSAPALKAPAVLTYESSFSMNSPVMSGEFPEIVVALARADMRPPSFVRLSFVKRMTRTNTPGSINVYAILSDCENNVPYYGMFISPDGLTLRVVYMNVDNSDAPAVARRFDEIASAHLSLQRRLDALIADADARFRRTHNIIHPRGAVPMDLDEPRAKRPNGED